MCFSICLSPMIDRSLPLTYSMQGEAAALLSDPDRDKRVPENRWVDGTNLSDALKI